MEFRYQKTLGAFLTVFAALAVAPSFAETLRFEVAHDHLWKNCTGTLEIGDGGLTYRAADASGHQWHWDFGDIQQLEISGRALKVLSYEDRKWKVGADKGYDFELKGGNFDPAYNLLHKKLDERFVAAIAGEDVAPLWKIPVKHLTRFGGHQGVLIIGRDRIVFRTEKPGECRTWRYRDVENISTTGPFQLTLTSYERALTHYGNLKAFNFQLKQRLSEDRYDWLWRRLNAPRGLDVLQTDRKE